MALSVAAAYMQRESIGMCWLPVSHAGLGKGEGRGPRPIAQVDLLCACTPASHGPEWLQAIRIRGEIDVGLRGADL